MCRRRGDKQRAGRGVKGKNETRGRKVRGQSSFSLRLGIELRRLGWDGWLSKTFSRQREIASSSTKDEENNVRCANR